jgi:hypothetical protein
MRQETACIQLLGLSFSRTVLKDTESTVQLGVNCHVYSSVTCPKNNVGKGLDVSQTDEVLRRINLVFFESVPNNSDGLSFSSSNLHMGLIVIAKVVFESNCKRPCVWSQRALEHAVQRRSGLP